MLPMKRWFEPGRRLLALFLTGALLLTGAMVSLVWQLVRQERALTAQRLQERREIAADLAVLALQKSLAHAEEQLARLAVLPRSEFHSKASAYALAMPGDSVLILDRPTVVSAYPERRLPFYPVGPSNIDPSNSLFAEADSFEFQQADYSKALAALRGSAQSKAAGVPAAAWMRIGRIHRKQKLWSEALADYQEMLTLKNSVVDGVPAGLIARQQRVAIFAQTNRPVAAREEADNLRRDLMERRFVLTRSVYEFYLSEAQRMMSPGSESGEASTALALAAAAESLHAGWGGEETRSGRIFLRENGVPMLAFWHTSGDGKAALILGPQWVEAQSAAALKSTPTAQGVAIRLTDDHGGTILGPPGGDPARETLRLAAATQLPWNLHTITTDATAALAPSKLRRQLVLASLAAIAALILVGSYLIAHSITRDLALSRLQSDFVSAVSHEFRTPLTSLCILTEQLASGRVTGDRNLDEYYSVLARESQRLRRLVEGLLNFGRMEAGAAEYRFETTDPAELVHAVSLEFELAAEARNCRIEVNVKADTPLVLADRAALACAVWNLLDNAVKYSPGCPTVWADVEGTTGCAAIRIRDCGPGIPAAEQPLIFEKFVRGEAAKQSAIRGTGVGLAMVRHIVAAHGGELRLESKVGEGSAFTMLLPEVI